MPVKQWQPKEFVWAPAAVSGELRCAGAEVGGMARAAAERSAAHTTSSCCGLLLPSCQAGLPGCRDCRIPAAQASSACTVPLRVAFSSDVGLHWDMRACLLL